MSYLRKKYYYKQTDMPKTLQVFYAGYDLLCANPLFTQLDGTIIARTSHLSDKTSIACVTKNGDIFVNSNVELGTNEWAYVLAHNLLHLAFGHFDKEKMPEGANDHPLVWNKACDIYVTRFLADIGFGKAIFSDPAKEYPIKLNDEARIYSYLLETEGSAPAQAFGCNADDACDMIGIEAPSSTRTAKQTTMLRLFPQLSPTLSSRVSMMPADTTRKMPGRTHPSRRQRPGSCHTIHCSVVLRLLFRLLKM